MGDEDQTPDEAEEPPVLPIPDASAGTGGTSQSDPGQPPWPSGLGTGGY